jgi:plasmid stabilization system protein ParE
MDARNLVLALHERSPAAARRLAGEFAVAAERLVDFPRLGMAVEPKGCFSLPIVQGRYRLNYALGDGLIRILGLSRGGKG